MKKFAVYVVVNGNDRRVGTAYGYSKDSAMSKIPQKVRDMGRVYLVPIMVEA
jgi:hypothetical protein